MYAALEAAFTYRIAGLDTIFLLSDGLPNLGVTWSPFVIAVLGFTLNVSAYNARYLTIAYKGLEQAELQSARAQGFSPFEVFRLITAPQSLRMSVPSLTNQAIQNIKDSSIVFLIQYIEFFAQMQEVASHVDAHSNVASQRMVSESERTVLRPEEVRRLPDGVALVIYRNAEAMLVDLIPWTARPDGEEIAAGMQRVRAARVAHYRASP